MRSLAISAAAGGGAGVVIAGEGDRLGGGEGACEEDDGDDGGEGSGVLRLTVSRLGSAGKEVIILLAEYERVIRKGYTTLC